MPFCRHLHQEPAGSREGSRSAEMYALLTGDKAVDLAEFYIVSDVELTQGEELSVAIEGCRGRVLRPLLELPHHRRRVQRSRAYLQTLCRSAVGYSKVALPLYG